MLRISDESYERVTLIYLGGKDQFTNEYLSKELGKETICLRLCKCTEAFFVALLQSFRVKIVNYYKKEGKNYGTNGQ